MSSSVYTDESRDTVSTAAAVKEAFLNRSNREGKRQFP